MEEIKKDDEQGKIGIDEWLAVRGEDGEGGRKGGRKEKEVQGRRSQEGKQEKGVTTCEGIELGTVEGA